MQRSSALPALRCHARPACPARPAAPCRCPPRPRPSAQRLPPPRRRTINPQLGLMTSLRSLRLEGNPTKIVRRELLSGPLSALLEHLRTKLREEELAVQAHRPPAQRTSSGARAARGSSGGSSGGAAAAAKGAGRGGSGGGHEGAWKIGAASSGSVLGGDEFGAAAEAARKVAAGRVSGQEMLLAGRGLQQVPREVWDAGPQLVKLDLSCNRVRDGGGGGSCLPAACGPRRSLRDDAPPPPAPPRSWATCRPMRCWASAACAR
jgi:hypothetical protein